MRVKLHEYYTHCPHTLHAFYMRGDAAIPPAGTVHQIHLALADLLIFLHMLISHHITMAMSLYGPNTISQSTILGRTGSNACTLVALLFSKLFLHPMLTYNNIITSQLSQMGLPDHCSSYPAGKHDLQYSSEVPGQRTHKKHARFFALTRFEKCVSKRISSARFYYCYSTQYASFVNHYSAKTKGCLFKIPSPDNTSQ